MRWNLQNEIVQVGQHSLPWGAVGSKYLPDRPGSHVETAQEGYLGQKNRIITLMTRPGMETGPFCLAADTSSLGKRTTGVLVSLKTG